MTEIPPDRIPREWWQHQATVIELDEKYRDAVDSFCEDWAKFRSNLQPADEMWFFTSPIETWTTVFPRCGLEGYVQVRDGKIVDVLITAIS